MLVITSTISSCVSTSYIGDVLSPTNSIDVFYATKDVKRNYKVIGHIAAISGANENNAKARIIKKSKAVGADGVIVLGLDFSGGKSSEPFERADVIKYLP